MFKAYTLLSLGLFPLKKNPTFLWIAYESFLWALMHPSEGEFVTDVSVNVDYKRSGRLFVQP